MEKHVYVIGSVLSRKTNYCWVLEVVQYLSNAKIYSSQRCAKLTRKHVFLRLKNL